MTRPGLLVSVRSRQEAVIAVRAGADLIDLKEPAAGPLGMCGQKVAIEVAERMGGRTALSAALGEWHEWRDRGDEDAARRLAAFEAFDFVKLGPYGSAEDDAVGLKATFKRLQELGPARLRWIAVLYADRKSGQAADREHLLELALDCGCAGVLIDTFDKSKPANWDASWLEYVRRVRGHGLLVALAGGLTAKTIRRIAGWQPDWFAVRGAACREGNRDSGISFRRVSALKNRLGRPEPAR